MTKLISYTILTPFFLLACTTVHSSSADIQKSPASVIQQGRPEVVVTYQERATDVGYQILQQGGNAFDAFVASTAAQYVLAAGVTSFSGPLGALIYDAKSKKVIFLDATFNDPLDPRHKWDAANPQFGAAVLVPGAVAGLEAISKKYGKLPFKTVLAPAIEIAEKGFPLDDEYAGLLRSDYGKNLKRSPYALKTYFRDGVPLQKGETLRLPVVAEFLRKLSLHGSQYVYRGQWAKDCLKAVNSQGGHLTAKDFSSYKPLWTEPVSAEYRGYKIYSPAIYGGVHTLLSLRVFEHADVKKFGQHYSSNAEGLATLTSVYDQVLIEPWLNDDEKVKDAGFVANKLTDETAKNIWKRVEDKVVGSGQSSPGSHSYHIVIIDREGNAITGTNTIESFPWGNDIFVEGIPLTASGSLPFATKPGQRRKSPLSMQIGFKDDQLKFAVGAFSASLLPAEFQYIVNIVDYDLSANDVVSYPRFGSRAWDFQTGKASTAFWLDRRVDKAIVKTLADRRMQFTQDGYIDTGLGSVALMGADGMKTGATAPMSSIGQSATKIVGIGAVLGFSDDHKVFIRDVLPGSPAQKFGLQANDVIVAVQSLPKDSMISLDGKSVEAAMTLIRGPKGVIVKLQIQRGSELKLFEIARDEFVVKR